MRAGRWARTLSPVAVAIAGLVTAAIASAATPGPSLSVNGAADHHPISPYIYGLNFASAGLANQLDLPVDRWGGNTTDTYNWKIGASNLGNDWYFENVADCWDGAHAWCSNGNKTRAYREFVAKDRSAGAKTLLTLPMMGRVAKDAPLDHPLTCGFPASAFPSQDDFDPYDTNCGNGRHGGQWLPATPSRTGTQIGPSFDGDWVTKLKSLYGSAANGGVRFYELGNEPALWSDTHHDMHPARETYDELWQKSRDYGAAVKAADPTAKVLGFSEWGWPNYFCSAADHVENGCFATSPDRANHGGAPLVEWFLRRMRDYQQANGKRLLDYLDLHYYAQGGDTIAVTRSLWDPTYTDPSWINDRIKLIPRMKQWVAQNYPGTKLSLSEYNLSVGDLSPGDPTTNALIQADVLGIFAREGLDLATRWGMWNDGDLIPYAFRIYRNYDGNHSRFGNTWVRSVSGNQGALAVYGARRSGDGAYTILVINKTAGGLQSPLNLSGISPAGPAQVWRWTGGGIAHVSNRSVPAGGFTATYPARSLTLYVIPD
jgi:glycosyl hydrolase family 44